MSVFEVQTGDTINAYDGGYHPETPPVFGGPDDFDANGPNRLTIWIPTEEVVLNMGGPVNASGVIGGDAPGTPEIDAGFVAQTQNHIHFHTFGEAESITAPTIKADPNPTVGEFFSGEWVDDAPAPVPLAPARAVLRLGKPMHVVSADGKYGSTQLNQLQTPVDIGSAYPTPFQSWAGYAMITEGGSYQESWGNNIIVAGYGDLRLAGNRTVMIGSPGDVHLFADGNTIPDAVANDLEPGNIIGTGKWVDLQRGWVALETVLTAVTVSFAFWTAAEAVYHLQYARSPQDTQSGWKPVDGFVGALPLIGGFVGPTITLALMIKSLASPRDPNKDHGNVSMYAASNFSATGLVTATLHSEVSSSVTSLVSASLTSVVSTSVSSALLTSVSGALTSVGGLKSVSMSSQFGSATVHAKTTTEISSHGKVFVTGNDAVQVNSNKDSVYVHGKAGFYLGCGAGAETPVGVGGNTNQPGQGYGIVGTPDGGLKIGNLTQGNLFTSPGPDDNQLITVANSGIIVKHMDANLTLANGEATINGKRINLC